MVNPKKIKVLSPITKEFITVIACMIGMYYVIDGYAFSFTNEDILAKP